MKKYIFNILILTIISNVAFSQNYKDVIYPKSGDTINCNISSTNVWHFGIKGVQQINYPISHSIIAATFSKRNHNIYIGPNFTHLFENYFGDELVIDDYRENSIGVNFGYRYVIDLGWKRINLFIQLDYSVYEVSYKVYQGKYTGEKNNYEIIVESNGSIGINYKLFNSFEIIGGIGIGRPCLIFHEASKVWFHSFLGLEYKIK